MNCITFSWVILLSIIIISILMLIMNFLDNSSLRQLYTNFTIMSLIAYTSIVMLMTWWLLGWVNECDN